VLICVHLWLILLSVDVVRAADLLIRNVRLIDGTGSAPRAGVSILVRDGRITEIGSSMASEARMPVLDVSGATVIPGLIDAHMHNAVVPGSAYRKDSTETLNALRRQHLRGYLAAGVTTVLDTGIPADLAREIRVWLADGQPGPNLFTLGPPLAAPGGYGSEWVPETTVSRPDQLDAAFDLIQSAGAIGVKVLLETGFAQAEGTMPTHSPEMRDAIAQAAAARHLPIYVHASSEAEQRMGLAMGAYALVHMDFYAQPPSAAFIQELRQRGTYIMTTFSILDAELTRWHPERLDDALVTTVVPERERATARDPEAGWFAAMTEVGYAAPRLPRFLRRAAAWWFITEESFAQPLRSSMNAAKTLHDAGVALVIGSDAGNWPILPYQFHAASTHREIELLAQAGLSAAAVLAAATRVPARMLGVEHDLGTIEAGKRADLVVVDGDPLTDVRALRKIRWTIKDGVARTPQEWMTVGQPVTHTVMEGATRSAPRRMPLPATAHAESRPKQPPRFSAQLIAEIRMRELDQGQCSPALRQALEIGDPVLGDDEVDERPGDGDDRPLR
jgi:imidazolonepropionase-like amidohydrolase